MAFRVVSEETKVWERIDKVFEPRWRSLRSLDL